MTGLSRLALHSPDQRPQRSPDFRAKGPLENEAPPQVCVADRGIDLDGELVKSAACVDVILIEKVTSCPECARRQGAERGATQLYSVADGSAVLIEQLLERELT